MHGTNRSRGDADRKKSTRPKSSRRQLLKLAGASGIGLMTAGCISNVGTTGESGGDGPIKLGELQDRSGALAPYGVPKHKAAELAVKQINDDGGLLDRDVELIAPDPQSSNKKYKNLANRLVLEDNVDVLVAAVTSSAREAIRPIVDKNKQLYFYPEQYEGGVCDEYTFVTGAAPTQQVRPLVPMMINEYGPKCYILAADYNFGTISAAWTRHYLDEHGGELVGEEFIPVSVSEFGSTVNRVQEKDPDWVMSLLVGANHNSYYKQAHSAGAHRPMASSTAVLTGFEHKTLPTPVLKDMYVGGNYMEELPTERNEKFVDAFRGMFPDTPYVTQSAVDEYNAIQYWAKAAEKVGTVDQQEVQTRLEEGLVIESPEGDVRLSGETHHMWHDIHVARVDEEHNVNLIKTENNLEPSWLKSKCSLNTEESTWEDPVTKQFLFEG